MSKLYIGLALQGTAREARLFLELASGARSADVEQTPGSLLAIGGKSVVGNVKVC